MDKGILRFMAEAYLLLHPGPAVDGEAPPDKGPKEKLRRSCRRDAADNKESTGCKPSRERKLG
jgi:hypothetical protein